MKLFFSAYFCFPGKFSEPGNAWHAINEPLRAHEVWAVIEQKHHYAEWTEHYLAKHPVPRFHPIFLKLSPVLGGPLQGRSMLKSVYYHLWQENLANIVRDLHQRIGFDLANHVTYGRYWSPSGLRVLKLPFIWGLVGTVETPRRSFVAKLPWHFRLLEFMRETAHAATIGIGVTRKSCEALRNLGVRRVEITVANPICFWRSRHGQ